MKLLKASVLAIPPLLLAPATLAGPDRIAFPEGYRTNFVRYTTVDKPDREPPIVRFFYVNPEALAAAQAGTPLPDGTVAVMEDHPAELDAEGKPVTDSTGRFVPTDEITNVFVQEKRAGWGEAIPEDLRNGDWDYAWFLADGSRKTGENVDFDRCFTCHKGAASDDFTFTLAPFVNDIKG